MTTSTTARWRRGLRRRALTVSLLAFAVMAALFVVALLLGPAGLRPEQVWAAFTGRADDMTAFVVLDGRLPRASAAVTVGMCLGVAGAVFQSVLRNPLASPDVVGVTSGAATAGVLGVLILQLSGLPLALLVMAGGLVSALVVAVLTWQRGMQGLRLVLVGIGVAALATAVTSYLLTTVDVRDAQVAYTWLVGSLSATGWPVVGVGMALAVAGLLATAAQAKGLRALELGDAAATSIGVPAERTRAATLFTAALLTSAAVGIGGPISFVALMAPQIARRLVGRTSLSLTASAAIGGALVTAADLLAQYAIPSVPFPVGVVTGVIGAPYLAWLLARNDRARPGGTA